MAGVTVAFEELESEVAATAAVAASRRTNTRNNFFGIHSPSFEHRDCSSHTKGSDEKPSSAPSGSRFETKSLPLDCHPHASFTLLCRNKFKLRKSELISFVHFPDFRTSSHGCETVSSWERLLFQLTLGISKIITSQIHEPARCRQDARFTP